MDQEAADQRDLVADERDLDALEQEHAATALAIESQARLDAQDAVEAQELGRSAAAAAEIEQIFTRLRAAVGRTTLELDEALVTIELHLDQVHSALLRTGIERDRARSDLRSIAQHLAAAAAHRQAAAENRAVAAADRHATRRDRDRSRTGRQESAIDGAPRGPDKHHP
jgi:hypothetical protein